MDFGQLEAFAKVASNNSFSRAAEVLQLTQPSVTSRIQALERELGEELFERRGRGVRLTDAGSIFLPYTEKILRILREGKDSIQEVRRAQLGSLRIGCAFTISAYVLPRVLQSFRHRYPRTGVTVHTGRSEQVLTMLLNDEVQIGLVRSLSHSDIYTIPLYEDEVILVVNPQHEFTRTGRTTMEAVASEPIIFYDRASSYYGMISGLFRQAQVVPNVAMELDSMEATKRMVEEGLGVALLPRDCVERELRDGTLAEIVVTDVQPVHRSICLILRKGRRPWRTVQAFLDVLSEIYRFELPETSEVGSLV
jgi:DNA-binding transcriptional LysR family regulator